MKVNADILNKMVGQVKANFTLSPLAVYLRLLQINTAEYIQTGSW